MKFINQMRYPNRFSLRMNATKRAALRLERVPIQLSYRQRMPNLLISIRLQITQNEPELLFAAFLSVALTGSDLAASSPSEPVNLKKLK